MRRKILLGLALSVILLFVLVSAAFATQGDSTYLPSGGVSPHGGYQVNTKKCGVCHAVHHAGAAGNGVGSEALLRSTRADACTYCHISPGVSTKIVYGGVTANYSGGDNTHGHNLTGGGDSAQCVDCHQVHAAASDMTLNPLLSAAILKKADVLKGYDPDSDPPNLGEPQPGDPIDVAITKWCTRCHQYFDAPGGLGDTHVLTVADGTHAFAASSYCVSCHNSDTVGGSVPVASAFPHYTDGVRFLTQSATDDGGSAGATGAADSQYDGVCLRCHRDGLGNGIGQTF